MSARQARDESQSSATVSHGAMQANHRREEPGVPLAAHLGIRVRTERRRRHWTIRELARRAGVSPSLVQWIEAGGAGSLATYAAVSAALGLTPEFELVDPRRPGPARAADPVHAALGEVLAARLAAFGHSVALDEPYQHYQFAGRGDVVAWSLADRSFLHVENRTDFPNLQDAFGSYNAKRRWIAPSVAQRVGLRAGWVSETHVMLAVWSSDVLHAVRLRTASFQTVCPDGIGSFEAWWHGRPIEPGVRSCFVLFDPLEGRRSDRRRFVDLEAARAVRPRYTGYADAVRALRSAGLA